MEITQEQIATVLQLGGQYMLPAAALLKALHNSWRGKTPEGIGQIVGASVLSGLTAMAGNEQPNLNQMLTDLLGNTVFMTGLLSFIVLYLVKGRIKSLLFDAIVGAVIFTGAWVVWVYVLGNTELTLGNLPTTLLGAEQDTPLVFVFDLATLPFVAISGALIFIVLRFFMRQIGRLVKLATVFLLLGMLAIIGAGALLFMQQAGIQLPFTLPGA